MAADPIARSRARRTISQLLKNGAVGCHRGATKLRSILKGRDRPKLLYTNLFRYLMDSFRELVGRLVFRLQAEKSVHHPVIVPLHFGCCYST
jgi:hypothetical protein